MSTLDQLLQSHVPPPPPADLAARAAERALAEPQLAAPPVQRRRDRRGGWRRPLWIGTASLGLAFTSAVAATVASHGRIEIPVVKQVVAAIPVLASAAEPPRAIVAAPPVRIAERRTETVDTVSPASQRPVAQGLERAKALVEQRRAAGLPTPRADRIERQAQAIVERRQARGLESPPVEQVEGLLALREVRRMRAAGGAAREAMVQRIIERLPPAQRARFEQLTPEQQQRLIERLIARRQARLAGAAEISGPSEGSVEPVR